MEELYLVKTNIKPSFLFAINPTELIEWHSKTFSDFLDKIARRYPAIDLPIFAITDNAICVPDHITGSGHVLSNPSSSNELSDLIDKFRVGKDTIYVGHTIPITAIVDFTNSSPVVLGAYNMLKEKYKIREMDIKKICRY